MDVIFSAPFSGALYRWFAQCLASSGQQVSPGILEHREGYYHHAFAEAREITEVALATLVMVDNVYLAGGDLPAPAAMRAHLKGTVRGRHAFRDDLGVTIGANALHEARQILGNSDDVRSLALLPAVAAALHDIPVAEHEMELAGAVADALLVGEYRRPLVCGARRRGVFDALISVGVINQRMLYQDSSPLAGLRNDPVAEGEQYGVTVGNYMNLRALRLAQPTLELVGKVKDDKLVRASAESFQTLLVHPSAPGTSEELHERLERAASSHRLIGKIDRIVGYGAYGLGVTSLVSGVSPVIGATSVMAPVVHLATRAANQRDSWFQLDTRINYVSDNAG